MRLSKQIASTEEEEGSILALGRSCISLMCCESDRGSHGLFVPQPLPASASGLSSACRHLHLPAGGVGGGGWL